MYKNLDLNYYIDKTRNNIMILTIKETTVNLKNID